jgi:inhibitor of cysteine peptidase
MSGQAKKNVLNGCLLLIIVLTPSIPCHALDVADRNNGGEFFLGPGETLTLKIFGNPTTGYLWQVVECDRGVLMQRSEPVFVPDSERIGSGGKFIFRFSAGRPGSTRLKLVYRRPWERNIPPAKTFELGLTVRQE